MYFRSEDEVIWSNTLYPQYQLYENHLNSFIDGSWPISLHQNEITLAKAILFYLGNGGIVICVFCGIHLIDGFQTMIHLQNTRNLIRIANSFLYIKISIKNQQFNTVDHS